MEGEHNLRPFSIEQITQGEKLPDNLSTIRNEVGNIEGLRLNYVLDKVSQTQEVIENKTRKRFMILGSMAMYSLLSELRVNGRELMILEQRISGGKNDMDIDVAEGEVASVMEDFGWDDVAKGEKRGLVTEGSLMVDVLSRKEKPHFPCQKVLVNGKEIQVQSPEEMIFEKLNALLNPAPDKHGKPMLGEVKWGVDIKLLKAYLMEKNRWSSEEVENHLANKWGDYLEDTRYETVRGIMEKVDEGGSVEGVLRSALEQKEGKPIIGAVKQSMVSKFGEEHETIIDTLLVSNSKEEIERLLRQVVDFKLQPALSYQEATERAMGNFAKLLSNER